MLNFKDIDFLDSIIQNDSISINAKANDWKESIRVAFKKLIINKCVTKMYPENVIKITEQHGPYYIIGPGIAMPHSRPEDGALKNCFSLVVLEKPVLFDDQEIKLLIGFAATDAQIHLEKALPQIVAIFEDTTIAEKIISSKNKDEVLKIIKNINYMKYVKGENK